MFFPSASLKRSPRTRTRKNADDTDIVCPSPRSSVLTFRKTRPPPLQIIPELSDVLDISAAYSPVTARPVQIVPEQPDMDSSRVTLSAYTFSIDDALLMFAGDAPRSPALSASSSTSDSTSSEDVPATPRTSDNEDRCNFVLLTPRLRPQRVSIRPLCITKPRHLIYQEDEETSEEEREIEIVPPCVEGMSENSTAPQTATQVTEEAEQDFYARELEDFVSFLSATPFPTFPARRDSLILVQESLPTVVEVFQPKPRGRSRHSKPLPLLPPATPPASTMPSISNHPLIQTTAQKFVVRSKHNMRPLPHYPPPPIPVVSRPLPRMSIPLDIEDCALPEESLNDLLSGPIVNEVIYDEDASIYSQPSFAYSVSASTRQLPSATAETRLSEMYGEVILPRSSTDSDGPRSSIDSTPSSTSSVSTRASFPPHSPPSSPSEERLRSRWSSSTLGSVAAESHRAGSLFSPLRGVFSSRARWVPSPPHKIPSLSTPSKILKCKHGSPATPSPPSKSSKRIRRQGSQSSTSSAGTSSS